MAKVYPFPNSHTPGRSDWITYVMEPKAPGDPQRQYRVDLSWMLSNWKCTYGEKCPSILINGVNQHHGCCQDGVHFGLYENWEKKLEEHGRVREAVKELTPEDWDHGSGADKSDAFWTEYERHTIAKKSRVKRQGTRKTNTLMDVPEKTKMVDGACIFANRPDGPAGKMGCAFHHLAERTGRHHSETKPDICWMMPFSVGSRYDDDIEMDVFTVTSINGSSWGPYDTGLLDGIGHWCTEIPDHFCGDQPVWKYAETDLRKIMGNEEYERMVDEILKAAPRRYPTPGESVNGGRPLLPLLVENRRKQWEEIGDTDKAAQAEVWLEENNVAG